MIDLDLGETGGKARGTPVMKPLSLLALMAVCAAPALAANPVRISQIYGGGGNTTGTPTYKEDYIEVYNSGDVAVDIGGWWLQYGTTNGLWASAPNQAVEFPPGTIIQPCQYMLVATYGGSAFLGSSLFGRWDFAYAGPNMSATSGKVLQFQRGVRLRGRARGHDRLRHELQLPGDADRTGAQRPAGGRAQRRRQPGHRQRRGFHRRLEPGAAQLAVAAEPRVSRDADPFDDVGPSEVDLPLAFTARACTRSPRVGRRPRPRAPGVLVEGTTDNGQCMILSHQTGLHSLCFIEAIPERGKRRQIGFNISGRIRRTRPSKCQTFAPTADSALCRGARHSGYNPRYTFPRRREPATPQGEWRHLPRHNAPSRRSPFVRLHAHKVHA